MSNLICAFLGLYERKLNTWQYKKFNTSSFHCRK